MTSNSADPIQEIATSAMASFAHGRGKLLIYAEIEPGVISCDLFFQPESSSSVQFRFAAPVIRDLIFGFWESGSANITPRSWAAMQLVVHDGRVTVDFHYPDQLNPDEELSDRRPRVLSAHFPGVPVDYSLAR
jgi:hypothetical protein